MTATAATTATATTLLRVEIERALRRRLVWALIAVAIVGIVTMAIVAFVDSVGLDVVELERQGQAHPAVMRHWWRTGGGDGPLVVGAVLLMLGAVIGGASAVGADWRGGTLTTWLTWEPRRVRVAAARLAACALCAAVIAAVLQVVLLLALLPAVVAHGSAAGTTGAWWVGLVAAIARISAATAMAAVLAASISLATRSTAAAIIACWMWLSVIENIARGVKPWSARYLVGDNIVRFVGWADMERGAGPTRSPSVALVQLVVYLGALAAVATWTFSKRDAVTG